MQNMTTDYPLGLDKTWIVCERADGNHVVPVDDDRHHTLSWRCQCDPRFTVDSHTVTDATGLEVGLVLHFIWTHAAFDNRQAAE